MSASVCSIKKKFPSIHWECVVCVNLPPGMPGPGLSVPSAVQSPVRKSSFLSSGAGVGGPICACIATAVISSTQKISTASDVRFIDVSCKEVPGGQIIGESRRFVNEVEKNLQTLRVVTQLSVFERCVDSAHSGRHQRCRQRRCKQRLLHMLNCLGQGVSRDGPLLAGGEILQGEHTRTELIFPGDQRVL